MIVPQEVSNTTRPPANGGAGGVAYCFVWTNADAVWSQPSLPVRSGGRAVGGA